MSFRVSVSEFSRFGPGGSARACFPRRQGHWPGSRLLSVHPRGNLLPAVRDLRSVAVTIAAAVARQARAEGLCEAFDDSALGQLIARKMWEPVYRPYYRKVS